MVQQERIPRRDAPTAESYVQGTGADLAVEQNAELLTGFTEPTGEGRSFQAGVQTAPQNKGAGPREAQAVRDGDCLRVGLSEQVPIPALSDHLHVPRASRERGALPG